MIETWYHIIDITSRSLYPVIVEWTRYVRAWSSIT